jgi:hypothetical protein
MTDPMWGGSAVVGRELAAGVVGVPVVPDASAAVRVASRVLAALSPATTLSFPRSFPVVARRPA